MVYNVLMNNLQRKQNKKVMVNWVKIDCNH